MYKGKLALKNFASKSVWLPIFKKYYANTSA